VIAAKGDKARLAELVGIVAVLFSALYFISDVIELSQGGFSTPQLAFTYASEAAVPLLVLGLYAVQRPQIGRLGFVAAVTYAYTFVFFTATVVYALLNHTRDWEMLQEPFGAWMSIHSALMVIAGVSFGVAVARAQVLPRWTGITLVAGMVLMTATTGLPEITRTMSAGVRDLAFAGMGASLLGGAHSGDADVSKESRRRVEAQTSVRAFVERPGQIGARDEVDHSTGLRADIRDHLRSGGVRAESNSCTSSPEHLVPRENGGGFVDRPELEATSAGDVSGHLGCAVDVTRPGEP
jgi:hypothetical protein